MIIEINNFGTIDHLRIDTSKNLSLIYGMNGIGKSYAVACVYCVLKSLEEMWDELRQRGTCTHEFLEANFIQIFEQKFRNSFPDSENWQNKYSKKNMTLFIEYDANKKWSILENNKFQCIFFKKNASQLHSVSFVSFFSKQMEKQIYFVPQGRAGLYTNLSSLAPIIAELSANRLFLQKNKSFELPTLSQPVSDYFIQLSTVKTSHTNPKYQPIIQKFEQKILKGEIRYDEQTRKMQYLPEGLGISLDVQQSASMVAELSSLLVFFKHVLKDTEENIIFIEEPEAHLHPATQIALMEILDEFAKAGVKIFLTSHSNYMFNKLGNMLLAGTTNPETVGVYHLVMTPTGSVQNMNMQASKEGIEDDNFTNVAEQLYNERLKIYEQNEPN
jgi:predicted ATPase